MSEKATIALRLFFAFVVLSGATYYGVATSQTRSQLRRLDYLGRQILTSLRDGTPLHERALVAADLERGRQIRDRLDAKLRAVDQEKSDGWRLSYCFDQLSVLLVFDDPTAQPTLHWTDGDPGCREATEP